MYHGRIDGPLVISDELAFYGMAANGVVVRAGGRLHLFGVVTGDLRIDDDGRAVVAGVVTGSLYNEGDATVTGSIGGAIYTAPGGTTELREGARVAHGGQFRCVTQAA